MTRIGRRAWRGPTTVVLTRGLCERGNTRRLLAHSVPPHLWREVRSLLSSEFVVTVPAGHVFRLR